MNRSYFRTSMWRVALLCGVTMLPATTYAQTGVIAVDTVARTATLDSSTPAPAQVVANATRSGPRVAPAALVASHANNPFDVPPRDPGENVGPNLALMGVGAAAVVVGLLIGGDGGHAVAVGGAVIGLVGLYRYMR